MNPYTPIAIMDRAQLFLQYEQSIKVMETAQNLKRFKSTIYYELNRSRTPSGYQ